MLGLGVLLGALGPELLEDLDGARGELAGLAVDELQLPLDAQAGALGGLEGDLHPGKSRDDHAPPHPPARAPAAKITPAGGPSRRPARGSEASSAYRTSSTSAAAVERPLPQDALAE